MLARTASFRRRSRRAETDKEEEPPAKGFVGKIVRSASFSRRGTKHANHTNNEETDSREETSESRSATPDTERGCDSPEDAFAASEIMQDRLYGWLKKRHHRSGNVWAKRYFFVDETRGTLGYSKAVRGRGSKPSTVLPLSDVTSISLVDTDPTAFIISCPPIHLTVAAVSAKERKVWVRQLEMRVEVWTARQREKQSVANFASLLSHAKDGISKTNGGISATDKGAGTGTGTGGVAPQAHAKADRADGDDGNASCGEHSPPHKSIEEKDADVVKRERAMGAGALEEPFYLPCSPEPEPEPRPPVRARAAPPQPVQDVSEPAARTHKERRSPHICDASNVVETVEFNSDDDDGDDDDVDSANRASSGHKDHSPQMRCPAPVPLAAMISSDEDEELVELDSHPPIASRRAVVDPAPKTHKGTRRGARLTGNSTLQGRHDVERDAGSTNDAPNAAGESRRAVVAPVVNQPALLDASLDNEDDVGTIEPLEASAPSPLKIRNRARHETARGRYEDDCARQEKEQPAAPPPNVLLVGPNIVADANFVEEDWDDE